MTMFLTESGSGYAITEGDGVVEAAGGTKGFTTLSWKLILERKYPNRTVRSPITSASHGWELWDVTPGSDDFELLEYRRPNTDDGYREFRHRLDREYGPFPNVGPGNM